MLNYLFYNLILSLILKTSVEEGSTALASVKSFKIRCYCLGMLLLLLAIEQAESCTGLKYPANMGVLDPC